MIVSMFLLLFAYAMAVYVHYTSKRTDDIDEDLIVDGYVHIEGIINDSDDSVEDIYIIDRQRNEVDEVDDELEYSMQESDDDVLTDDSNKSVTSVLQSHPIEELQQSIPSSSSL